MEDNKSTNVKKTVKSGITFGSALAMVISYTAWKSVGWAIFHGLLSWCMSYTSFCVTKFAFVERSRTMKAPVGLLSDRTVLRQQDGGASPRQVHVCGSYKGVHHGNRV